MGHVKMECRLWKREQAKEKGDAQKNDKDNIAAIVDGHMCIVYDECSVNLTCHTSDWVIDLGASLHVTARRDYFTNYVNGDYDHVRIGNERAYKIVGIEDICLETSIGYSDIETRHEMLVHIGEKGLETLAKKGFIPSFAAIPLATYSMISLGAKFDGRTDSTKAFLAAWAKVVSQPRPQPFTCHLGVTPSDYNVIGDGGNWILFEHVNGVYIYGGILDGQGAGLWACKRSGNNNCPSGATTLGFSNSNNILINGLTSQNSQMFHVVINGCHNVKVQGVRVSASGNSPNTDGIHVQSSSDVTILNARIGTEDDCVSVGPGTTNLWIENVACGPGHGISIGSLGKELHEAGVQNPSGVKISDMTYQDIHGSSATEVVVKFDCSPMYPCFGINLEDVKLIYKNQPAEASCRNADGSASGFVQPNSCLKL
ncbi:Pectin lyase-like superfamily protein [Citrus sinensis]|uniref:Pectin lyase-like superfamily protein n=1 Tax=Citrus sinensis TaxID=2711 RepID=A0ACB8MAA4_CITSI|nr:Pectin lyase-like superfamily protein [Citrus sinensis]